MADALGGISATGNTAGSALDRQADQLLQRFGTIGTRKMGPAANPEAGALSSAAQKVRIENTRIDKSAGEFESILLGTWLEQAEQSFAKVPGGDGQADDADPGSEQLQGIAVQSLAGALTASGGIGIAKMIARQLHRSADPISAQTPTAQPANTRSGGSRPPVNRSLRNDLAFPKQSGTAILFQEKDANETNKN